MGWIDKIADGINKAFEFARPALPSIPVVLLLCEIGRRPGVSAIALASATISNIADRGIETGINPCGAPNKVLQLARIFAEELVKEYKDNAQITCALNVATVNSTGTGTNAGGAAVVQSSNIMPMTINGIGE